MRERIQQYLQELKVTLPDVELDKILAASEQTQTSYLEFLERVLSGPANQRRENGIARRIRQAGFRNDYTLENFNWKFNAASIDRAHKERGQDTLRGSPRGYRRDNPFFCPDLSPPGLTTQSLS